MSMKKVLIGLGILAVGFYLGRNLPILNPGGPLQPNLAG